MKDFFKFTFASMLGVVLAGIVFTILGIVSMVGMVASSDTETVVQIKFRLSRVRKLNFLERQSLYLMRLPCLPCLRYPIW